jgi:prophage antirepressor-like protein
LCRALGISNPRDAVSGLDDDEKDVGNTDTLGGNQQITIVSESGLFALIFKSRKPNAVKFRKWVTSEVLPTLRRTGAYFLPGAKQMVVASVVKPWAEWSLEERRVALAEVNTAKRVFNTGTAAWMWSHVGLPTPPRHLLPAWWPVEFYMTVKGDESRPGQ